MCSAWNGSSRDRQRVRSLGRQPYRWFRFFLSIVAIATTCGTTGVLLALRASAQAPLDAAGADLPSVGDRADYVVELLRLINAERRHRGIPPLRLSQPLNQAAQQHAEDMAFNDFFSHLGSDGTTLRSRLAAAGYESSEVAENIAAGRASPRETVQQWLNSPGHRANLLNPEFTEVGFGYSNSPLGRFVFYWTQVLGRPAATASQSFSTTEPAAAPSEAPAKPAKPELASPEREGAIAEPAAPAWEEGESPPLEPEPDPTPSASAAAERPDPEDLAEDEPPADAPAAAAAEVAAESSEPAQASAAESPSTAAGRAASEPEPPDAIAEDREPGEAAADKVEPETAEPVTLEAEPDRPAATTETVERESVELAAAAAAREPVAASSETDAEQADEASEVLVSEPDAAPAEASEPEVESSALETEETDTSDERVSAPASTARLSSDDAAGDRDAPPSNEEPLALLEIEGILEDGDRLLPVDDSLYDLYTFRGTAGQVVRVELESDDFDPYLFLIAPDGQQLAENDDISRDNRNSALRLTLPVNGTYSVLVNSYDPDSRGRYRLVIR